MVKKLAMHMAAFTNANWQELKGPGRYLKGKQGLIIKYDWQSAIKVATASSDSDWAGDKQIRKSTSGGSARIGDLFIKSWSKISQLSLYHPQKPNFMQ